MAARELPGGTVTLLFTDIEGSTRMLQELGRDAYVRALTDHRRLLREAFAARGGVEVEMQGDSFFFAFPNAQEAVEAAVEGQRALAEHVWESEPVRVRIGLHTGEPTQADGLYAGLDVHWAARVMSAGHGGQVLLSERTAELVSGLVEVRDLGVHRLKDISAPQRLYQAGDGAFPPLKTLHVTSLPVQANRLIGRQSELAEISQRIRFEEARLLTLTGPGGTGKTRLALQAAADLVEHFEGGVYFVPLAAIHEPSLVLPSIAKSLGVREQAGQSIAALLAEHIGQRRTLLVLDNFEQVVEAAQDVAALLADAPGVSLLVTSREQLRVAGEQGFAVPALPDVDAVALFVERARSAGRLEPTGDDTDAISAICALLDGLPLAIELAAARAGVLSPQSLVARLDRSLDLLTTGPRDADERQRTLRATIEWSYDLLGEPEQRALARLAVFPTGFALETAERVCEAGLDELMALFEQSLLMHEAAEFRLLRVIREFALERLDESGDAEETRLRHARWCLELGEEADAGYRGDDAATWLARIEARHDDFRAALAWARDADEHELLLDLAVALSVFWQAHGHLTEGMGWFEEVLANADEVSPERLVGALQEASSVALRAGMHERMTPIVEQHLDLCRRMGNHRGVAYALSKLGQIALETGDHERARDLHTEAAATARDAADERALMVVLSTLGNLELLVGNHGRAVEVFAESLELVRRAGRRDSYATALFNVGLANVLAGASDEAAAPLRESLLIAHELGDREGLAYAFEGLAAVAAADGRERDAAVLLGAADALLEACGASLESVERALHERTEAAVRGALGAELEAAWNEGRSLPVDELVERIAARISADAVRIP